LDKVGLGWLAIWSACSEFICDKGQENDWFGSSSIRWAAIFFVIGFIGFVLWELLHKSPLVNLRALSNRNLTLGCLLVFALGGGIYSMTTVLPLFYQTLMGYDATNAGLAVAPRGLGSVFRAVLVGLISSKVDPRKLVALGFAIFGGAALWTGSLTLEISPTSLFWPITVNGLAISLVFVPLSNVALGTMPQEQIGNASGLII
jgi:DHA2 family multidrug resistance protein